MNEDDEAKVVDGAAAVLLASPDYVKAHGLKPRARVVTYVNMGDDPTLMLNAPVPAAKKALETVLEGMNRYPAVAMRWRMQGLQKSVVEAKLKELKDGRKGGSSGGSSGAGSSGGGSSGGGSSGGGSGNGRPGHRVPPPSPGDRHCRSLPCGLPLRRHRRPG